jgi:chaperonin GroEL
VEYRKVQSASKTVITKGPGLTKKILDTMRTISSVVGATLGPGGQPVLIERFENGLPPMVTKDGVTVFQSLGFDDPVAQCLMESARDTAKRTAAEAGDGTTTATILFEAIGRNIHEFCEKNKRMSPQKVVRHLDRVFRDHIQPAIAQLTRKANLETEDGLRLLHSVARISANGDTELADAVMKCFDITGDEGNVTIAESSGSGPPIVEEIKGYAIPNMGYEESCAKFAPQFVNDPGTQRTVMRRPVFLLYHGQIHDIQTLAVLMHQVGLARESGFSHNVVVVATGFSDTVLGHLAANFSHPDTINVFPLNVPLSIQTNGQMQFLMDLSAITGAKILNPLSAPIEQATLEDLGPGVEMFEAHRFRSSIVGHADEFLLLARIDELKQALQSPESELDAILLRERIAKLAGGIAKLRVVGSSNGELKEKRDRAEDAVCAVRGAIKHGCLPGGAWTLLKLCHILPRDPITDSILRVAFMEPFNRLMQNCGITDDDEARRILEPILEGIAAGKPVVYDFLEQKHVDAFEGGILDSTPAVLEAIRNSISIGSFTGTLSGMVVFARDSELERQEARATNQFLRAANYNPADERP